jgi:hypothetical protein
MALQADISTEYSMGRHGSFVTSSTSTQTGNYAAIECVVPTAFVSVTGENMSGYGPSVTFPAGFQIRGIISAFQIASGTVQVTLARS